MTATFAQLSSSLAGRYTIDREIGRGGMATVFLARDLRHERFVALKVLNPELGAVLGIDRFLAEIRVTANLQHPNLLPLFDSGEADGLLFYVMPYVEGESLRARLEREKQLPVDEAIRIVVAVASALDYAHAHGVIHRDLKPENILIQAGQPVISDFGVALAVSNAGGTRVTQTGLSLGTPQYMSPEQASGERAIDGRSDVYSLAAVMYEMLAGEPPHTGQTMQAVIARVLTERPRGVRMMRPSVSEQVELSIGRGLEKLPADRWATAREFADALQGKAVAWPAKATATSPLPDLSFTTWRARARDPVMLALGAIAIVGATAGVWGWRNAKREDPGFAVRIPVKVDRPPAEGGQFSQIAISPNGKSIAYAQRVDSVGLWVRGADEVTGRRVPTPPGIMPFFSPDGAWLGFITPGRRWLMKVHLSGGPAIPLVESPEMSGASWAPGGLIIASIDKRLMVVPEVGGAPVPLIPLDTAAGEIGQRSPRVLADGKTVLYQSWRGSPTESRIGVASLANRRAHILDVAGASPIGVLEGHLIYGSLTGSIMAVPFDVARVRLTGTPIPVIDEVDVGGSGLVPAALSHTGSLVYAVGTPNTQVVLSDMRGNTRMLVEQPRIYGSPRFSPDGTRLAVSIAANARSDIWIHDLASGTTSKLTSEGTSNGRPEWHPDSKRVLYTSYPRDGRPQLWLHNADLSGTAKLIEVAPGTQGVLDEGQRQGPVSAGVSSARDERIPWLIVDQYVLYQNLIADTTRKPIDATPANEFAPKVSPDGKWIAYASRDPSGMQVYVQPFPPTGARHKVTALGGMTPVWSPDGNRIFYVSAGAVHAATIRTTPAFTVTARKELFGGDYVLMVPPNANYDVSPDGKHFVLLRPVDTGEQLVVVHGWKYELRERTRIRRER